MQAMIDKNAKIGANVSFGMGVRVYGNTEIGDDCTIGDFCILGHPGPGLNPAPLRLGAGATVRSHSILYEGSTIGPQLETGHHVVIREKSMIGENLRVGNFSDIEGNCRIGDFTRLHGYVHIGKGADIGDFVWIFSLTTLMNDPLPPSHLDDPVVIGDMVTICVNAQCMPGTHIGRGCLIAAGTMVSGEIPEAVVVQGPGSQIAGPVNFVMHMASRTRHPWHRHFADAYPERARDRIKALGTHIEAAAAAATNL